MNHLLNHLLIKFVDRFSREIVLLERIVAKDVSDLQAQVRKLHKIAGKTTIYEIVRG